MPFGFLSLNAEVVETDAQPSNNVETFEAPKEAQEEEFFYSLVEDYENEPPRSWRDHYTFGPGDVIDVSFYGRPELDRGGLRIAPDGTFSYLQANNIQVSGMTLEEIRDVLETKLAAYYTNVRLVMMPGELTSKRYILLGKVIDKGVFSLERPITILEALARSRGVETGIFEQSTIELADMDRAFIIRNGERLDVDFAALYYRGDLSQNILIEPDDYIYIPSNITNDYYVLGSGKNAWDSRDDAWGDCCRHYHTQVRVY